MSLNQFTKKIAGCYLAMRQTKLGNNVLRLESNVSPDCKVPTENWGFKYTYLIYEYKFIYESIYLFI